jgi:HD-GYP domain-containing protein (c-di-GMP phosphodiesterase class II)
MRLLDYNRLYRKEPAGADDLKILREHTNVGAAIVGASPLGADIANLVLAHHERVDGTGYPNRLIGDQIPVGALVIQICEAFDAMTATDSYQAPVPAASAVSKIRRAAGAQFDNDIALKFCEMMEGRG